jgi:hypothetical protein
MVVAWVGLVGKVQARRVATVVKVEAMVAVGSVPCLGTMEWAAGMVVDRADLGRRGGVKVVVEAVATMVELLEVGRPVDMVERAARAAQPDPEGGGVAAVVGWQEAQEVKAGSAVVQNQVERVVLRVAVGG